jgi:hypothetical protein
VKALKSASSLLPQAFVKKFGVGSLGNFSEYQIHFGMLFNGQMLGEPLEKWLCEGLVGFEKRLGLLIDQIWAGSISVSEI